MEECKTKCDDKDKRCLKRCKKKCKKECKNSDSIYCRESCADPTTVKQFCVDGTTGDPIDGMPKKDVFCTQSIEDDLCPVSCGGCPPAAAAVAALPQCWSSGWRDSGDSSGTSQCPDSTTARGSDDDHVCFDGVCDEHECCAAPPAEGPAVTSVTSDVTSATTGHADFTYELIVGGVASVALLALLFLASRCN